MIDKTCRSRPGQRVEQRAAGRVGMSAGVAGALRRSVRMHHLSRSPGIHWLSGELRQERERVGTVTALATQEPNDGLPAGLLRVRRGGAPLVAVEVNLDHAFTVDYALIALRP